VVLIVQGSVPLSHGCSTCLRHEQRVNLLTYIRWIWRCCQTALLHCQCTVSGLMPFILDALPVCVLDRVICRDWRGKLALRGRFKLWFSIEVSATNGVMVATILCSTLQSGQQQQDDLCLA
jgi:hypothetical protein